MGKLDTTSTVTLVINGEQSKTSLREITSALNATRASLSNMNREQDPARYQELIRQERALTAAQRERRQEIINGTEAQKGFFADYKKGFAEIGEMAGKITAGTLIYKGVSAGIEAIRDLWNGSESAFKEAEKTQAQLGAVLKSTAGAAGLQQEQLIKLQQAEMDKTGVDDDVIAKGEEMLLTFTNIHGKIYEQTIPAVVDMTSAMNGGNVSMENIQATSIQVGKALNDPINGMTSLRKVGVTFNDQQKEQIKNLQESGDLMGAQTIILKELQKEFGGTAEAIRGTASGALQAFDTDLGNLQERIGAWIVAGKGMWAQLFDPLVKELADTRSQAEKLTDEFNDQAAKVRSLDKDTRPLIERYQELHSQATLNKTQQKELKSVIAQIADAIPSAVAQWDKYGNAISLNTEKAQKFIDAQKAVLQLNNKDAISEQVKARNVITDQRNSLLSTLKSGKTTDYVTGGTAGTGTSIVRDLTDKEITEIREKLKGLTMDTKKIDDTIRGLTGSYMDDTNKKADQSIKVLKKLSEMTVGEIQDRVKSLNASLENTVIGSKEYLTITQQITDAEKMLNQAKKDKSPEAQEKVTKDREKKIAKYREDLDKVQSEYLALGEKAKAGSIDGLDAQLKVIDDKYNSLVKRLLTLAKDPLAAKDIDKIYAEIFDITRTGGLSDQAKDGAIDADNQKKAKAVSARQKYATSFQDGLEGAIDKGFDQKSGALKQQEADELALTTSEQAQLNIKEKYNSLQLDLEKQHLQTVKQLRESFGRDTSEQSKKLGETQVKITADSNAKKQKSDNENFVFAKTLTNATADLVQLTMGNSSMGLALQKTIALSQIAIDTAQSISAAVKTGAYVGLTPIEKAIAIAGNIAVVLGNMLRAKAELSGANDVKPGTVKKAAKGALIPDGPSHADGGINLINNKTGEAIAEMEGGEPLMILSRDTYANNRMLVNELLYNSQYRNGAPVTVNTSLATRPVNSLFQNGGVVTTTAPTTVAATNASPTNDHRLDRLEQMIYDLHGALDKERTRPVILNKRAFDQDNARQVEIDKRANA